MRAAGQSQLAVACQPSHLPDELVAVQTRLLPRRAAVGTPRRPALITIRVMAVQLCDELDDQLLAFTGAEQVVPTGGQLGEQRGEAVTEPEPFILLITRQQGLDQ